MSGSKPVYVLGINESHDASAALCRDGKIVAAIAQERVSRVKHHAHAVDLAVEYVLAAEGIRPDQLAAVVSCAHGVEKCDADPIQHAYKARLKDAAPIFYVHPGHHDLHALSTFYSSPFHDAAILVCDGLGSVIPENPGFGDGDARAGNGTLAPLPLKVTGDHCGAAYEGESHYLARETTFRPLLKKLTTRRPYDLPCEDISLGRLYSYASKFVFGSRNDAGKIMALAAYGDSSRLPSFLTDADPVPYVSAESLGVFAERRGAEADPLRYADLAARVQADVEAAVLAHARYLRECSGSSNLCVAGGLMLNCRSNQRIRAEGGFSALFAFPAATDDGISVGAALYGYHHMLDQPATAERSFTPYLGRTYSTAEVQAAAAEYRPLLDEAGVEHRELDPAAVATTAAQLIFQGAVLGWFQGGSEFGPRALGSRSIIAHPGLAGTRNRINDQIKRREWFRPLAPSVLDSRVKDWFEVPDGFGSPYMLLTVQLRPERVARVQEVAHVDGSARVQTVGPADHPAFHALIVEFERLSGIPMVLNTSLNGPNQPLVEHPRDALELLSTLLDGVIIENHLFLKTRRGAEAPSDAGPPWLI